MMILAHCAIGSSRLLTPDADEECRQSGKEENVMSCTPTIGWVVGSVAQKIPSELEVAQLHNGFSELLNYRFSQ